MWVVACLVGFIFGFLVATLVSKRKRPSIGTLRVDHSDDTPHLFLELSTNVDAITHQKTVTMDVKVEDFVPHE